MKHWSAFIFPLVISLPVLFVSCKKEKIYPEIRITSPAEGSSYTYGDTVLIKATIKDAGENIIVTLLGGAREFNTSYFISDKRLNEYTVELYLNDKYLESGNYDIRVSASNESASNSVFRTISYMELPLRVRGLGFISGENGHSVLSRIDSAGQRSDRDLDQVYADLSASSQSGQFLISAAQGNVVKGIGYKDLAEDFIFNNIRTIEDPAYEEIGQGAGNSYLLVRDGRIVSLDAQGTVRRNFALPPPYLPLVMDMKDDEITMGVREGTRNQYSLFILNEVNGYVENSAILPAKPLGIACYNRSMQYVCYYQEGQVVIYSYNAENGTGTEKYFIEDQPPTDMVVLGDHIYLSTAASVYRFPADIYRFPEKIFGFGANDLEADRVHHKLYMASGNILYEVPAGSGQNIFVASSATGIKEVKVMYNK